MPTKTEENYNADVTRVSYDQVAVLFRFFALIVIGFCWLVYVYATFQHNSSLQGLTDFLILFSGSLMGFLVSRGTRKIIHLKSKIAALLVLYFLPVSIETIITFVYPEQKWLNPILDVAVVPPLFAVIGYYGGQFFLPALRRKAFLEALKQSLPKEVVYSYPSAKARLCCNLLLVAGLATVGLSVIVLFATMKVVKLPCGANADPTCVFGFSLKFPLLEYCLVSIACGIVAEIAGFFFRMPRLRINVDKYL